MHFHTKHPVLIGIIAGMLLLVGILFTNNNLINNKYRKLYSPDQNTQPIRPHDTYTFDDGEIDKPVDLVPMLSFSEENTSTVSDIVFSKITPVDPIKYLQDGSVISDANNSIHTTSSEWLTLSAEQAGHIEMSDSNKQTIPLILLKLSVASMESHVEIFATFAHDNLIYYFPLFQNQDMTSSSYDLNNILKNYGQNLHPVEFRKININSSLADLFPPKEITNSKDHFVLIPFFPYTSCVEGGAHTFSYTRDAIGEKRQCAKLTSTDSRINSWSIEKINFRYPYKIVYSKNADYNHIELEETGKEPTDSQKEECWFSCIDYSNYRFIEGPAGLLYSYKLENNI